MAGRKLSAEAIPTPGPWLVRGEAGEGATVEQGMLGVEPATEAGPGGFPYLIRQDRPLQPGGSLLHLATGIQRLADAKLMASSPELAQALLRLLISPALTSADLARDTRRVINPAWDLLVRVAPHLEI